MFTTCVLLATSLTAFRLHRISTWKHCCCWQQPRARSSALQPCFPHTSPSSQPTQGRHAALWQTIQRYLTGPEIAFYLLASLRGGAAMSWTSGFQIAMQREQEALKSAFPLSSPKNCLAYESQQKLMCWAFRGDMNERWPGDNPASWRGLMGCPNIPSLFIFLYVI